MEKSKLEYVYVSFMQHINQPSRHSSLFLGDALDCIKNGQYRDRIEYLRTLDDVTYKKDKKTLPTIHFNGTYKKGLLTKQNFAHSSGLFHFDIDGLDPEKLACAKLEISAIPSCVFCFTSPSGKGLKAALRIDPDSVKCDADFKHIFHHAAELLKGHGLIIDESCKDVRRACFNGMVAPFLNGIKSAKVGVLSSTKRRGDQYEHYYNRDRSGKKCVPGAWRR